MNQFVIVYTRLIQIYLLTITFFALKGVFCICVTVHVLRKDFLQETKSRNYIPSTLTLKLQLPLLPDKSFASYVTNVIPGDNISPGL